MPRPKDGELGVLKRKNYLCVWCYCTRNYKSTSLDKEHRSLSFFYSNYVSIKTQNYSLHMHEWIFLLNIKYTTKIIYSCPLNPINRKAACPHDWNPQMNTAAAASGQQFSPALEKSKPQYEYPTGQYRARELKSLDWTVPLIQMYSRSVSFSTNIVSALTS